LKRVKGRLFLGPFKERSHFAKFEKGDRCLVVERGEGDCCFGKLEEAN
jgi:hypothetical protein